MIVGVRCFFQNDDSADLKRSSLLGIETYIDKDRVHDNRILSMFLSV